jgi:hypothetical protein
MIVAKTSHRSACDKEDGGPTRTSGPYSNAGSTIYALVCASAVRSAGAHRDSCLLCRVPGRRVIALVKTEIGRGEAANRKRAPDECRYESSIKVRPSTR